MVIFNVKCHFECALCALIWCVTRSAITSKNFKCASFSFWRKPKSPRKMASVSRKRKIFDLWKDIQDIIGPARRWPKFIRRYFWKKNLQHLERQNIAAFVIMNGLNPEVRQCFITFNFLFIITNKYKRNFTENTENTSPLVKTITTKTVKGMDVHCPSFNKQNRSI